MAEKRHRGRKCVGERSQPDKRPGGGSIPDFMEPRVSDVADYNRRVCRIVDRLRATRIMRQLSVAEAARQAGVSETTWSDAEDGAHLPSARRLPIYESWLAAGSQWFTRRPGEYVEV